MDPQARKTALRAITYGLYVVTAAEGGEIAAATVNWVTQASFQPPLVVVGLKEDSHTREVAERAGAFAVNVLGADQLEIASSLFRPAVVEGETINGYRFELGPATGAPLFDDLPCWWETRVVEVVHRGDHAIFVGEVVAAGVRDGDAAPLELRPTGLSYGG
jgi:flavin reductase (DIM6/NTAB) family NADH-FMN oxidoreductase RutF